MRLHCAVTVATLLSALFCAAAAAGCSAGDPGPSPEVHSDLSDAEPGVRAAIERALACVRASPGDADAWGTLGAVLAAHALTEDARTAFANAALLDPHSPRWPYLCAWTTEGDPSARVELLRRALEQDPGDAAIGAFLAESLAESGDRTAARAEFVRLLDTAEPRDPRALAGLARVELDEGNAAAARDLLLESVARCDRASSRRSLSVALAQLGDTVGAAREAQAAGALESGDPWPDPHVEYVSSHAVGPSALARRIQYVLRSEGPRAALPTASLAARTYPRSGVLQMLLGRCLLEDGRPTDAELAFRAALRSGYDSADTRWLLASALASVRRTADAIAECRRALELHPAHARAALLLGRCLYESGDREAAIETLECAIDRCGAVPALHARLAALLAEEGRLEAALSHARAAADLAPRDGPTAALVIGILARMEGR